MKMEAFVVIGSGHLAKEWWATIQKVVKEELAAEMGCSYRDIVMFCLKGTGVSDEEWIQAKRRSPYDNGKDQKDTYIEDVGYEEVGLEKEFYWNVVRPFDRITI